MASVFISYSGNDEAFANGLYAALEPHHQVWMDSRNIPAGTDFRASIDPALEACTCVVIVRTPAWLASEVCCYEAARAAEWHKRIVPVEPKRRAPGTVARDLATRLVRLTPRTLASLPGTAGAKRLRWSRDGLWLAVALADAWQAGPAPPRAWSICGSARRWPSSSMGPRRS